MVMRVIFVIYIFLVGACTGSFINVVTDRIITKRKLHLSDRSRCCDCGHSLGFWDLIPVFSYLILGGKCRYCKKKFSIQYMGIEVLFGLVCVLIFSLYGLSWECLVSFFLFILLYIIYVVDNKTFEIPIQCNVGIMVLALINCFILHNITWLDFVIGAVCISSLLCIMVLLIPSSFGGGDIKLFISAGAFLGWKCTLLAFFISLVSCTIKVLVKKDRKDMRIPFGPFIALGVMVSSLFGPEIITLYLRVTGIY